jgi:hypothetical protein
MTEINSKYLNDQYTYSIVIPLENEKNVSLKFIRSLNDTWVCTMSDECKRDLESILSK